MEKKFPFYMQSTLVLLGLTLFSVALVALREILVPLSLALVLAMLLNPLVNRFQKWGLHRVIAIVLSLVISFLVLATITYFIIMQVASFRDQLPVLKQELYRSSDALQNKIAATMGVTRKTQHDLVLKAQSNVNPMVTHALGTVLGSVFMIILLPVYAFLFLFYKTLILNFLYEVFARERSDTVTDVLVQTKTAIQSYMLGLLLEALIIAILNSIAFLLFGVKYAILIGVIGALLNMVPYIGGIIAVTIPVVMLAITHGGYQAELGVIAAYGFIQFVDNQFIVPYIVSSRVRINALISIIAVFLGGAAWGISGMFLSIPFIGVLKIVFDRVPELKPWGKLLGDEVPTRHKGQIWNRYKKPAVSEKIVGDRKK